MQDEPIYKPFTPHERKGCGTRSSMEISSVFWTKHNGKRDSTTTASLCPANTPVSYYKDVYFKLRFHCDCGEKPPNWYRHVCKSCTSKAELASKKECKQTGCRYFHSYLEEMAPRTLFRLNTDIKEDGLLVQPPCADPKFDTNNTVLADFEPIETLEPPESPGTPDKFGPAISSKMGPIIQVVPATGRYSWLRKP